MRADVATCDPGDRQMGPNCVHEERNTEMTALGVPFEWVYSTVYRTTAGKKAVVWPRQLGEIEESDAKHLVVKVTLQGNGGGPSEGGRTFDWDGSKYVER